MPTRPTRTLLYDEITTIDQRVELGRGAITKKFPCACRMEQVEWIEEVGAEGNMDLFEIGGRRLFSQWRRAPNAHQEGTAAAGPAAFQPTTDRPPQLRQWFR